MSNGDRVVAVDTQALIWGIREEGTDSQKERANWLFAELNEDEAQIIIPSVALAEYLAGVDPKHHDQAIAPLAARFTIQPFDVKCAALAAKLFHQGKAEREMGVPDARKILKADCLVVATAGVHAREFYSGDVNCRVLATKVKSLAVHDLPTIPPNLFVYKKS